MEPTVAPGMTNQALWRTAVEKQLEAIRLIDRLFSLRDPKAKKVIQEHGFDVDRTILKPAIPYVWSKETTQAVLAASRSIPLDTQFNTWTLNTPAAWWYFEEPLPFKTLELPGIENVGVRALCFGWMTTNEGLDPKMLKVKNVPPYAFVGCSAWCDSLAERTRIGASITPSQTWTWSDDFTLGQVLDISSRMHWFQYGPLGKFRNKPQFGFNEFMAATEGLSKFVLAAFAWLGQDIIANTVERLERHQRKEFNRYTGQNLDGVQFISLRKVHREHSEPGNGKRELSCQFTVDGHWRNQACGEGMKQRKLIWISPYLKGPEDKPFRPSKQKVYLVNR